MTHDSPVAVNPPYSNARRKTTIRVLEDLWEAFKKDAAKKHLSTCHVLEALMTAWLYGGSMVPGLDRPLNLTVNMQHVVKRPRRAKEVAPMPKKQDTTNHYNPDRGWYYDPDLDPGMVAVEQPREWAGEEKGFTWSEAAQRWWKQAR